MLPSVKLSVKPLRNMVHILKSALIPDSVLPTGPAGEPLYPPPNQTSYLTWEPDFAGLNNVRLQVPSRGAHVLLSTQLVREVISYARTRLV